VTPVATTSNNVKKKYKRENQYKSGFLL